MLQETVVTTALRLSLRGVHPLTVQVGMAIKCNDVAIFLWNRAFQVGS